MILTKFTEKTQTNMFEAENPTEGHFYDDSANRSLRVYSRIIKTVKFWKLLAEPDRTKMTSWWFVVNVWCFLSDYFDFCVTGCVTFVMKRLSGLFTTLSTIKTSKTNWTVDTFLFFLYWKILSSKMSFMFCSHKNVSVSKYLDHVCLFTMSFEELYIFFIKYTY